MSLSARLGIALVVLLSVIALALVFGGRYATERYFQEVNQELNRSIAMYVVGRLDLLDDQGGVNHDQLRQLADQAMTVNPSVEVYLLDATGRVLAHGLPPDAVLRQQVSLASVNQFLQPQARLPILGDDPRSANGQKAFSVHPIMARVEPLAVSDASPELLGYLYVVLGGKHFDSVTAMFSGSYVWRLTSLVVLATLVGALLLGLWLVYRYTQPLHALQLAVRQAGATGFAESPQTLALVKPQTQEVAQLKSDIEQMVEKLAQQFGALETADRTRRELIANVSHDLRTPLSSIQGYLETLLVKEAQLSAAERREFLDVAHRHSRRLGRLIGELFELAQLDSGSVALQPERFSLTELLHDVVQEFDLRASERQVALRIDAANVDVVADIALIQRVLENLVDNALRFTPAQGQITLKLAEAAERVTVVVEDNGCGIAQDDLTHIFERHYRIEPARQQPAAQPVSRSADNTDNPRVEPANNNGSGLGLAIVKRILELHNSTIEVRSELAKGTTFSFALAAA